MIIFRFGFSAGLFFRHECLIHFVWRLFLLHGSWTQGWGVLFHVYLEIILGISSWKCHIRAHVAFPWSFSVETNF